MFPDHFSLVAHCYARCCPEYPAARFRWLADHALARHALARTGASSAVGRARTAGSGPMPEFARALEALWAEPDRPQAIHWPLHLRAGRTR